MKSSIRFKLLIYMTVNIVFFAVLLFGSNTFFVKSYYTDYKKSTLIRSSQQISGLIAGRANAAGFTDENLIREIAKVERNMGGSIFIGTLDGTLYYPYSNGNGGPPRPGFINNPFFVPEMSSDQRQRPEPRFSRPPRSGVKGWESYNDTSFFFINEDPNYKIETLRYQSQLDNGLTVLVWVPMTGISESAAISNRFTAFIGIITIIITGIWAFFISGRFTRPITDMNRITKKISELDFSQTLEVDRKDEIGQLSRSINHLSYKLGNAITELNNKNRQLEADIDRERKLDRMRREFVSNVSHELKTPIFLIQGYAEGLKANIAGDREKKDFYCDVIMEETEKMDILVKDLLDLSQIESGMFPIEKTVFNLSDCIQDIVSKYGPIFTEKNIQVAVKVKEGLMAFADPIRTEQVISNFMNNAIDHVNDKKSIQLSVTETEEKIRISVYNSGQHIPEESIDKIWSSFYKVDKARTRDLGGTGLGLSIVKAIQEAHGNAYGAANVSEGVEFWIEMDPSKKV